ncbi:MAG: ABC transporter substrate-binding protein [Erysipelotrichaceae bacterium]|nr:ABC transporter substrate-binding protein [Erysipelotrichaceae bacterium]
MKKLLSLLLVVLMLISTVGCSKPQEQVESAADANGDFHIAVSLPYTGTNASYAEYIDMGIKVALKKLENEGWLNGDGTGKIICDYYDDKNDATEGATIATKVTTSTEPYYLLEVGSFASGVSYPCANIYKEAEIVQYALTCSKSDYLATSGDWGFSLSMTQDTAAARVAAYDIKYLNFDKIALIYSNDSWGMETCKFYTETAEKLGVQLLASEKYDDGQQDFTSILTKIKQTNPQLVMCFCAENDIVLIRQQAETVGLSCAWQVSSKSRTSNVLQNLGDLGEGLYGIYAKTKDLNDPVYIEYEKLYKEMYPQKFADDNNTTQKYADQGYNCMMTVIWAIKETMKTGTTRQAFRDKLATLTDFPGVQGKLTFATGRKILQIQYLSQIVRGEDGQLKWVNYEDILDTFDVDAVAGLK